MGNLRKVVLFLFGVYFLQTLADKYTDEKRPYEFGFTIDGEQHRHEKKDENGIIMGEFGFITADGVYHVTVYATDENGNFKILSMKNIRVKPYPTSPGAGVKKSKSATLLTAPQKHSLSESTHEEKIVDKQVESPAKSCSHCSLPTTTTTTVSPVTSKVSAVHTNSQSTEHYYHNEHNNNLIKPNPISLQDTGDHQKHYNSKTHQSNPKTSEVTYPKEEQYNKNSQNGNLLLSQELGNKEPNIESGIQQSYPQTNINKSQRLGNEEPNIESRIQQSYPQTNINNPSDLQDVISYNPVQAINPDRVQQNKPLGKNHEILKPGVRQHNPNVSNIGSVDPQTNQEPISRSLQAPINEDYLPNQAFPQNNQSDSGPKNHQQNNLNSNNNDYSEGQSYPQQQTYEQGGNVQNQNQKTISSPPTISNRQALLPYNDGEKSVSGNPKGERTPKSFGDFIQQSVGPEELTSTGPNLYRPSLPKPSDFSDKPVLLAAQIQKVDKNTNIYIKNPGESDGLPEGITTDDIKNLLYTFNYTVGFHGHHEKGYSNGSKQGYYYVTGRNGVRTRVDYVADEKGFRPKITQEILDIVSDEVPKPETEKDEKYGLKGYEFKWLYFPLDSKPI